MRRTDASLAAMAFLAASVQGLPARASASADEYSSIVYYGGSSAEFADMGSAEGKFGECALQPRAATARYNSYAVSDAIDDFGTLHHCNRSRLFYHFFENAVIHSNDVLIHNDDRTDDHTDDYTDDYVDNTAHSQLNVDRAQLY
ncbi:hypothetical protein MY5147_005560 [Beauveria neobassiana]